MRDKTTEVKLAATATEKGIKTQKWEERKTETVEEREIKRDN
jgi:hypothetical protein